MKNQIRKFNIDDVLADDGPFWDYMESTNGYKEMVNDLGRVIKISRKHNKPYNQIDSEDKDRDFLRVSRFRHKNIAE